MAAIKSSDETVRQVNLSIYVMYILYVMWMVAFMVVVSSKPTPGTDIVTEILRVIAGREEMHTVVRYLNSYRDELIKQMPRFNSDGAKLNYTFFAPTSLAFRLQTPKDTVDPMLVDANFRLKVLIRHFTRQSVSSNDLARLDRLVMADSTVAAITRSVDMKTSIDGAQIQTGFSSSFGTVHIVDRVFADTSEVIVPAIPDAIAIEEPSVLPPPPIEGGFRTVSSSEIDIQDIATFITTSLSANLASPLVLLSVVTSETQMVAGVNYRLELKFKDQMESEQNTLISCQVVVFHQPWTSTRQISSSKCNPPLAVASVEIQ